MRLHFFGRKGSSGCRDLDNEEIGGGRRDTKSSEGLCYLIVVNLGEVMWKDMA
jgi:hypothetical protein